MSAIAAGGILAACKPVQITIQLPPDQSMNQSTATTEVRPTDTAIPTSEPTHTPTPDITPTPINTYIPNLTEAHIEFLSTHEVVEGDNNRKVVMMTYDDSGTFTQVSQILEAFRKYPNCRATFFIIGNKISQSKKVIPAILEDGHVLGCHGWDHETPLSKKSDADIHSDFERCFEAMQKMIPGYVFEFVRFPWGDSVGNPRVLKIAAQWGMQHVYWTFGSGGLTRDTYRTVIDNVKPGSIVLSHMLRPYDCTQAGRIVDKLWEMGYSLESLRTGRKPGDIYQLVSF